MATRKYTMSAVPTAIHKATPVQDLQSLLADASRGGARAEGAWVQLLDRYARRVFAMARAHVRDDCTAEEIAQSVFATIATTLSRGTYTEQGRFESWLFRVTMNRVRDEARRRKRHARPTDPSTLTDLRLAGQEPAARAGIADSGEVDRLRDALDELNDADRQVVELRHHGALSFQQIADALDEPLGTVLARHHRALKKLRTIMEEQTT
jgi:RNA polymerase sigma-70 factor (ECF subfamily)